MDISTLLGILIGFSSLIVAFILEGGKIGALVVGSAALIVFGGTVGAVIASYKMKDVLKAPSLAIKTFTYKEVPQNELITTIIDLAKKARQEGLLSLEADVNRFENEGIYAFLKKGLNLVIDGLDINLMKNMLELDIYIYEKYTNIGVKLFQSAGGYAPTMGIIGTVMGLVHVLGNLSNPSALGPSIAVAFIATLYGVSSANLLWIPISEKLKNIYDSEIIGRELIMEGILSIQQGENPKIIEEKLNTFLLKKTEGKEGIDVHQEQTDMM